MKVGLKAGLTGKNVERLQRTLMFAGHEIARDEIERRKFGPSTFAAFHAFQGEHGLRRTKQVNRPTLNILLELEQNITINMNEAASQRHTPKLDQHRGAARGKFVGEDGAPMTEVPDQFNEASLASALGIRLLGRPADGSRAAASTTPVTAPVIWVDKGDEVLVHLESVHVRMLNGMLLVSVDLETDQTGRSPLVVVLAMGATNDPAGLVSVTDELPQGNGQLAARWGRVLQEAVWAAMLQLVRDHALERGLASRSLNITAGQLSFQPGAPLQAAGQL